MHTGTIRIPCHAPLMSALIVTMPLLGCLDEDTQGRATPLAPTQLAPEHAETVTPPSRDGEVAFDGPTSGAELTAAEKIDVTLVKNAGVNLLLGDDSTLALQLPADADADGFYEVADDEDPGSPSSIEIGVSLAASLTAGSWNYLVEVLQDDVPVWSSLPASLAQGANLAQVSLPVADGQVYVIRATATESGEGATLQDASALVVDAVLPSLSFSLAATLSEGDDSSASVGVQLDLAVSHENLPAGSSLVATSQLDGAIGSANVGVSSPTTLSVTLTSAGAHDITVTAADTAGNVSTAVASATLSLTVPTIAFLSPASGSTLSTLHDTSGAAGLQTTATVSVSGCEGGVIVVSDGGTTIGTALAPASGSDTVGVSVSTSLEGTRTWSATCADSVSSAMTSVVTALDITPPSAPSSLAPAAADVRRGNVNLGFFAPVDSDTSSVQLAWGRSPINEANFGGIGQLTRTVPEVSAGAELDELIKDLPFDTEFHIAVRAVDAAGNLGAVTTTTLIAETDEHVLSSEDPGWGQALSRSMGDVDGDGYQDLVVGIPNMYAYGLGGFEIIYGAATPAGMRRTGRIAPPAQLPCSLAQCDTVEAGWTVNVLPDLNGDGLQEIAVVAYDQRYTSDFVLIYAGTSGVMSGEAQPASVLEYSVDDYGGAWVVDGVGDVNGDGSEDWVIALGWGAETYLFLGGLPASGFMDERANTVIYTSAVDEYPGMAAVGLSRPGVSADALVISSYYPAAVWKIDGMASWPSAIDLASYTANNPGSLLTVGGAGGLTGVELSAGDLDGDGDTDAVALGESGAAVIENVGGALVLGGALAANNAIINGSSGVSGVDVNLDGRDDILTGAGAVSFVGSLSSPAVDVSYALAVPSSAYAQFAAGDLLGDSAPDVVTLVADSAPALRIRY